MNFTEFLNESAEYKKNIEIEEAINLIKEKCNFVNKDIPLVRGMNGSAKAYILEGQNGNRKSVLNFNYHTTILDECIKNINPRYPLRSKSIICATYQNNRWASNFGSELYCVFPYNTSIIGYLINSSDLNHTNIKTKIGHLYTTELAKIFKRNNIKDRSFETIVSSIEDALKINDDDDNDLARLFKSTDVKTELLRIFSMENFGYTFGTIKDLYTDNIDYSECWISGPCIAIRWDVWQEYNS